MTNILDEITAHKAEEVKKAKDLIPVKQLEKAAFFSRQTLSLKQSLLQHSGSGIIAEFKRKSPSKGILNGNADPVIITKAYAQGGASGLSILTDKVFFSGDKEDLEESRDLVIPILRKDFIIDEYQIFETKAMGADVILLIAACLSPYQVKHFAALAKTLNLEVLLEIHNEEELQHICPEVDIVGVNNRNLKTFTVDINTSIHLSKKIGDERCKISESGISNVAAIATLKQHGFNGFLIGETFMKEPDPAIAFANFIQQLKLAHHES